MSSADSASNTTISEFLSTGFLACSLFCVPSFVLELSALGSARFQSPVT